MPEMCVNRRGARWSNIRFLFFEEQLMRKILTGLLIAGVLAGCSSAPTKEQDGARVEDRIPSAVAAPDQKTGPADAGAASKPLGTGKVAGDPLKDPGSILSKRSVY